MPKRIRMSLRLSSNRYTYGEPFQEVTEALIPTIAEAILDAYEGTVDDEGDTLAQTIEELHLVFQGTLGPLLRDASLVIQKNGDLASGILLCDYRGEATLTYTFTKKAYQRLGYATLLIGRAAEILYEKGYHSLYLYVTMENKEALRLYESLGFVEVPLTTVSEIYVD